MNKRLLILLLAAAGALALLRPAAVPSAPALETPPAAARSAVDRALPAGEAALAEARQQQRSNVPVEVQGVVLKVLPDDRYGQQHQRFIVRLPSGQALLVAHNIDLAPRVAGLRAGDRVQVRGEYVWNAKGGVIHWTHRDPHHRHAPGWIRRGDQTYQ